MKKLIRNLALTVSFLSLLGGAAVAAVAPDNGQKAMTQNAAATDLVVAASGSWFGSSNAQPQQQPAVQQMAQANDPRLSQLQEQVRDLTGRLEEMNFQILQMQEQMRKVQEDNDFRFEELEKQKKSDAGSAETTKSAAISQSAVSGEASSDVSADPHPAYPPEAIAQAKAANNNATTVAGNAAPVDTTIQAPAAGSADSMAIGTDTAGNPHAQAPRALGSIRFDANGNVIGGDVNQEAPTEQIASLPQTDNPMELYQGAYQFILAGDYRAAEVAFRSHIDRFPADPMTADARYWLGEALYGQERYAEAATVFIDMQRDFPESKRGAENMLKLGLTMAKLNDRDVACATLGKVATRYPNAAPAVLKRAQDERAVNHCVN